MPDDEAETAGERAAQYAHEGGALVAYRWLASVINDGDYQAAWQLSTPTFRLVRVQWWLWNNQANALLAGEAFDDLAVTLMAEDTDHPLWESFQAAEVPSWRDAWRSITDHPYGLASRPRPVGVNREIVLFAPTRSRNEMVEHPEGSAIQRIAFVVRFLDRWRVDNAGSDRELVPGWPPTDRLLRT